MKRYRWLPPAEYHFPRVQLRGRLRETAVWELARMFIEPTALDRLPQTREIRWLIALCAHVPAKDFLRKPWLVVMPDYRAWMQARINNVKPPLPSDITKYNASVRARLEDVVKALPESDKTGAWARAQLDSMAKLPANQMKIITAPSPGWTQVVETKLGLPTDRLLVEIDLLSDLTTIMQQMFYTVLAHQYFRNSIFLWEGPTDPKGRGQGKATDWQAALNAIGICRLIETGRPFAKIAKLCKCSLKTVERANSLVCKVKKTLFPFL